MAFEINASDDEPRFCGDADSRSICAGLSRSNVAHENSRGIQGRIPFSQAVVAQNVRTNSYGTDGDYRIARYWYIRIFSVTHVRLRDLGISSPFAGGYRLRIGGYNGTQESTEAGVIDGSQSGNGFGFADSSLDF